MENPDKPQLYTKVKKVTPTHVGQKCPVCGSYGTVGYQKKTCHACNGKGYILVPAEEART